MDFLATIKDYVQLSPRHGWVLLFVGAGGILLVKADILGLSKVEVLYIFVLFIIALTGFAILAVAAGFGIYNRIHSARADSATSSSEKKRRALRDEGALETARILNGYEAVELAGILSRGERRFVKRGDVYDLYAKGIIVSVPDQSDTYLVTEKVWEERDKLMRTLAQRIVDDRRRG